MTTPTASFRLDASLFTANETVIAQSGALVASAFRYRSGVAALRLRNDVGEIIVLPFQGQQVWDATFHGRRLTMRSMFDEPQATRDYLRNYGALLLHCGGTSMGNPGPDDDHPLHGELPNLPLDEGWLHFGRDDDGSYAEISGEGRDTLAFSHDFTVRPTLRMYEGESVVGVDLAIENTARTELALMYLAHINFRPVDGAVLFDAALEDSTVVRPQLLDPSAPADIRAYHQTVAANPAAHRMIQAGVDILPELVLTMRLPVGSDGWAHALQCLPDGSADFVSYRPRQLPYAVRWITRGPNQDALGLVLPATAPPDGLAAARRNGHLVAVASGAVFQTQYRFGSASSAAARLLKSRIVGPACVGGTRNERYPEASGT